MRAAEAIYEEDIAPFVGYLPEKARDSLFDKFRKGYKGSDSACYDIFSKNGLSRKSGSEECR